MLDGKACEGRHEILKRGRKMGDSCCPSPQRPYRIYTIADVKKMHCRIS
jgi:hypothetical protein